LGRWEIARGWGVLLFGILGVIVGIYTFYPGVTAIALLYLIAAWALVCGIIEIVMAGDGWHNQSNSRHFNFLGQRIGGHKTHRLLWSVGD